MSFEALSIQLIFPVLVSLSWNFRQVVLNVLKVLHKLSQYPCFIPIFMTYSQILASLLEFVVKKRKKKTLHKTGDDKQIISIYSIDQFWHNKLGEKKPKLLTIQTFSILLIVLKHH